MKKQDIRNAYTQKVTELLNQGYTIFPDTMNGSQGEIAHIDLTNGSEIIRVLLERGLCWSHISDGFHGDVVTLTVDQGTDKVTDRSRETYGTLCTVSGVGSGQERRLRHCRSSRR